MDPSADDVALPGETSYAVVTESATRESRETPEDKAERQRKAKILALMRKRWKTANDAWAHFHRNAIADAKFRAGTWGDKTHQWVDNIQEERAQDGRPCLTINRAPGFVHQVTNQARSAHLRIQVSPVDDLGDPKVAEVLQGIIRNIETNSFADWQYARANDKQAEQGLGFIRLITEWADDDGFKQRIRIKGERNPLRVVLDPAYEEPDAADAQWGFKATAVDRDDFADQFGVEAPSDSDIAAFETEGNRTGEWFPGGKILVVEYFAREATGKRVRKAQLSDGTEITYPTPAQLEELKRLEPPVSIVRDRTVQAKHTMWRTCTALDVIHETIWPDKSMPWVPVAGDDLELDGERDFRGVIRDSKDAARVYNVEVSALVEAVGRGIKAPVVGYRGQFGAPDSPMRRAWEEANRKPKAFLEIEPMDIDGKPAPRPEPITFEPPIQGTVVAIRQADEDYKSTAGFHDASLGQRGPQEAGIAIEARQRQDALGSSHYLDNFRMALCALARRLISLIRVVYDVPTVVRITGLSDQQMRVMVFSGAHNDPRNPEFRQAGPDGQPVPFQLPDGVSGLYDLGVGEFDIEVSAAPDSGTRRQEQVEAMAQVFKGLPPEYAVKFMDLWFMLMDHPVAQQMADRAKKMLPPELQDEDQGGPAAQIPPAAMAQMAQMKQQLTQAMQMLEQAQAAVQGETLKLKGQLLMKQEDSASRERIEAFRAKAALLRELIKTDGQKALALLQAELDRMDQARDHAHAGASQLLDLADKQADRQQEQALAAFDAVTAQTQAETNNPPQDASLAADGAGGSADA